MLKNTQTQELHNLEKKNCIFYFPILIYLPFLAQDSNTLHWVTYSIQGLIKQCVIHQSKIKLLYEIYCMQQKPMCMAKPQQQQKPLMQV